MGAPVDPIWEQEDYAFYTDGTETDAVIIGTTGSQQTLEVDTAYHCRLAIGDTNGTNKTNPLAIKWQYNLAGGGWVDVTTTTPIQFVDNANLADGGPTTNRDPVGTGTFNVGLIYESASTATIYTPPLTEVPTHTEVLLHFLIDSAQVTNGQEILVRCVHSDGTSFTTYVDADINVNEAAGATQTISDLDFIASTISTPLQQVTSSYKISDLDFISSTSEVFVPSVDA